MIPFLLHSMFLIILVDGVCRLFIRWAPRIGLVKDHKPLPFGSKNASRAPYVGGVVVLLCWIEVILASRYFFGPHLSFTSSQTWVLVGGPVLMFAAGLADDKWTLPYGFHFVIQILAASMVIASGFHLEYLTVPFFGTLPTGVWGNLILVFWVLLVTNAINFIDGLDGLAAGVCSVSLFFIGCIKFSSDPSLAFMTWSLAVILLAYLRYAWHPARTFLGNSGAFLIGFLLSFFSFKAAAKGSTLLSLFVPIMIMAVPVLDLVRLFGYRIIFGRNPFKSDAEHLHYKLIHYGLSHASVVILLTALSFCFGLIGCLTAYLTAEATNIVFVTGAVAFFIMYRLFVFLRTR